MGVFGIGLYSGDFAMDLRSTVSAVASLPFDGERLVEILTQTESAAANNSADEDHSKFWLIVADQFSKRGIISDTVRTKALEVIDSGADLEMFHKLGANASDIRKRERVLQELRARIAEAPAPKHRSTLKKPQPLLMQHGDVILFPTCRGKCINPYYPSKELDRRHTVHGLVPWTQDGWAAAIVIDCGRAFDFLAWYRPLVLCHAVSNKPSVEFLRGDLLWRLELPGTCSAVHFKRMELERIGTLPIDMDSVNRLFPGLRPGVSAAVSDISIANRFHAMPDRRLLVIGNATEPLKGRSRAIEGIEQILMSERDHKA